MHYENLIVRDLTATVPEDIKQEIFEFRYREHFHLSFQEFKKEPWEALYQANLIWSLEDRRDKLEKKKGDSVNKSS